MPQQKSALKRLRQSKIRHVRNTAVKSSLKTIVNTFLGLIEDNKIEEAQAYLPKITSAFDKASKKGVIHDNTAARKKSRVVKKLNKAVKK
ncbi:MAG: 30S ribosomal protein S20 [Candidatus Ancaeobacter aquaticus]|nr:30S ribosomal protein S20 [Candidatus Ancaeobacter aquaticus]